MALGVPGSSCRDPSFKPTNRADEWAGAATAQVGRAEGHAVGWRDARRAAGAPQQGTICERRDSRLDGPNVPERVASEERAATSVRRVGGEATLRALALTNSRALIVIRVPEVSLRRRRVLLVAARSSPCGAARGTVQIAINKVAD